MKWNDRLAGIALLDSPEVIPRIRRSRQLTEGTAVGCFISSGCDCDSNCPCQCECDVDCRCHSDCDCNSDSGWSGCKGREKRRIPGSPRPQKT